jgi:hypothetical protein
VVMEERARILARETGCIQRERKFDGASLLQMLVFGWLAHPDASLEQLASTVATREVLVTDTAVHERFNKSCAHAPARGLAGVDRGRRASRSRGAFGIAPPL